MNPPDFVYILRYQTPCHPERIRSVSWGANPHRGNPPACNSAFLLLGGLVAVAIASAGICGAAPVPGIRQIDRQQLKSMSLEQLGNVKVTTVSKQPEEVWNTPAAIFVLTSEDIRRSGATSIPELLRMGPGVQVSRMQSGEWAVGIRGFADQFSSGLLVMIDGRSVYTPLFEGVYWDVQDLPLSDIDRIEVIRGPAGAVWGANAVNGVINIITKRARDTQGVAANAIVGGPLEHFIGMAQYGRSFGPNLQARIWGKGFNRGPELNPGGNPYDRWHQERAGFRADWQPNARDSFTFDGQIYQGESGGATSLVRYTPPGQVMVDGVAPVSGGDMVVRWDHTLSVNSNFYLQGYFDRTNRAGALGDETRDTFDLDFVDRIGFLPRQDVILGATFRRSPSYFVQRAAALYFTPESRTNYINSGFVQDRIKIVPGRLSAIFGTKVEDNDYSGIGVEPGARLLWNPTPHQTVWGSVSRALRVPGRLDTDVHILVNLSPTPPIFIAINGNPNFKPEVLIGWQAGYRRLLTRTLYVDLALFHNQYDDLKTYGYPPLVPSFPTQPYPHEVLTATYANGAKGVTDGLEVAPDWKPSDWLELRGTYSHLHMALHSKAGFGHGAYLTPTYIGSSPDRIATGQALFTVPHGIQIDPDFRYMSALPAANAPAYWTADVHLGWKFAKHLELEADGRSLLQPSHLEFVGDDNNAVGIRRSLYGGIRWVQ
ncbi:MAG: TonB-dependent receptor plug domain-containing protein [Acidobacteriaceae bacterium]